MITIDLAEASNQASSVQHEMDSDIELPFFTFYGIPRTSAASHHALHCISSHCMAYCLR